VKLPLFGTRRNLHAILAAPLIAAMLAFPVVVFAYSCTGHCYTLAGWTSSDVGAEIVGGDTTIGIVSLGTPDNRLNNEMWLVQPTATGACTTSGFGTCWFEGGYTYIGASSKESYFTAWMSPETGSTYTESVGPQVGASEYGKTMSVEIRQDSPSGGYYVTILPPIQSGYTNDDSASTLVPARLWIGAELVGVSGGSAATADFTNNRYITQSNGVYTTHYPTVDGYQTSANPPAGSWYVTPSNSSTGGDYQTSCC
jgi:hypothetical protein